MNLTCKHKIDYVNENVFEKHVVAPLIIQC